MFDTYSQQWRYACHMFYLPVENGSLACQICVAVIKLCTLLICQCFTQPGE